MFLTNLNMHEFGNLETKYQQQLTKLKAAYDILTKPKYGETLPNLQLPLIGIQKLLDEFQSTIRELEKRNDPFANKIKTLKAYK